MWSIGQCEISFPVVPEWACSHSSFLVLGFCLLSACASLEGNVTYPVILCVLDMWLMWHHPPLPLALSLLPHRSLRLVEWCACVMASRSLHFVHCTSVGVEHVTRNLSHCVPLTEQQYQGFTQAYDLSTLSFLTTLVVSYMVFISWTDLKSKQNMVRYSHNVGSSIVLAHFASRSLLWVAGVQLGETDYNVFLKLMNSLVVCEHLLAP